MISLCSNNIMDNLYPKHGLVSRTYSKNSLIIASTFGSKSKFFMTMSIPLQDEPLTNRPVVSFYDLNAKESWALLEDLALYDNESWNDPRDFAKPAKLDWFPKFMAYEDARLSPFKADFNRKSAITIHPKEPEESQVNKLDMEQEEGNHGNTNPNPHPQPDPLASITTEQVDGEVMFIEIIRDDDEPQNEGPNEGEGATTEEQIPCNIRHVHIEKAYIDLNFPLNIMTQMMYNWIMRKKLNPRENANGGISNFTGRIKGMDVFVGNFTYVIDFMIVEDISSIIEPMLSQVIEQYDSLSDLEKEHTKSVYLRNKEDKIRGVEYVMSKILGFYKDCLELGPEYLTRMDDDGEVTKFFIRNKNFVFTDCGDGVMINTQRRNHDACDGVTQNPDDVKHPGYILDEKALEVFLGSFTG
ncbi:hypothetical protein Tco_0409729 [Tanacetum coccineum]